MAVNKPWTSFGATWGGGTNFNGVGWLWTTFAVKKAQDKRIRILQDLHTTACHDGS